MVFLIPKGGKILSHGKKLLHLRQGEFETADKDIIAMLENSTGVTKKAVSNKKPKGD